MSFSLFDPESPGVRTGAGHQWPSAPGSDYIHTFLCSWPFCPVPSKVEKENQTLNSKPKGTKSMAFWKRQNSGHSKKIDGCQELGGRMDEWMEHRGFSSSEATFCCCSVAKSHPILCNSMDCNPPGSSVLHYFLRLLKFMSIELVILSNHLILCRPLLLLLSIFSSIRVFSNELALHIRWSKYGHTSLDIHGGKR